MLANPAWLLALAALAMPLALHLWSRRPRRVIKVGSLRHLDALPPAQTRSARLSEPLLLLLRLLVLATVALALAGPRIAGPHLGRPARLTLVEPSLLTPALLDSLRSAPGEIRLLAPGLPPATPGVDTTESLGAWDGLEVAERIVAAGGEVTVIARPRVTALGARRPALGASVSWVAPSPPNSATWLAALTRLAGDTLLAVVGTGDAGRATYQARRSRTAAGLPAPVPAPAAMAEHHLTIIPEPPAALLPRLDAALAAVTELLGQRVVRDAAARDTLALTPALLTDPLLADTILARWPWRPDLGDRRDPREVAIAEALPAHGRSSEDRDAEPITTELLLLAATLLLLERWFATRRPGGVA